MFENYSKTSGSFWWYYRYEPNPTLADSESFKFKVKISRKTNADGNTNVAKILVPLRYLSNFWRTFEMSLINCKINLILIWSSDCVITNSTSVGTFAITDRKRYVPVISLSTQGNAKRLGQIKSGFQRTINWDKY